MATGLEPADDSANRKDLDCEMWSAAFVARALQSADVTGLQFALYGIELDAWLEPLKRFVVEQGNGEP